MMSTGVSPEDRQLENNFKMKIIRLPTINAWSGDERLVKAGPDPEQR